MVSAQVELLSDDENEEAPLAAAQPAEERSEVEPGAEVRGNAVHVYGACLKEFMSHAI